MPLCGSQISSEERDNRHLFGELIRGFWVHTVVRRIFCHFRRRPSLALSISCSHLSLVSCTKLSHVAPKSIRAADIRLVIGTIEPHWNPGEDKPSCLSNLCRCVGVWGAQSKVGHTPQQPHRISPVAGTQHPYCCWPLIAIQDRQLRALPLETHYQQPWSRSFFALPSWPAGFIQPVLMPWQELARCLDVCVPHGMVSRRR